MQEEKKTDALLTQIAESFSAPKGDGEEGAEEMPEGKEAAPKRALSGKKARA